MLMHSKHRSWLDWAALVTLFTLPVVIVVGPVLNYVGGVPLIQVSQCLFAFFGVLLAARGGARSFKVTFITFAIFIWMVLGLLYGALNLGDALKVGDILQFSLNIIMLLIAPAYRQIDTSLLALRRGWLSAFFVAAVAGFINLITGRSLPNSLESHSPNEDLGISATFHNPNTFGFFLVITFPIFVAGAMDRSSSFPKRLCHALGAITTAYFVLETRSELCLAAILSQLIVLPFLLNKTRRPRPFSGFAFLAVVLGAFWWYFVRQDSPGNEILLSNPRFAALEEWQSGEMNTIGSRIELWNAGMQIIRDQYGFGAGPTSFADAIGSRGLTTDTGGAMAPHNGYLEVAVEYGVIVALLLFVAFISVMVKAAMAFPHLEKFRRNYALVIILQIVGASIATFAPGTTLGAIFMWVWGATLVLFMSTLETEPRRAAA
ncbi:O-antigen ligase family protein [Dietzia cinnamea]|uniref:O-antigen ligase family protein n=1 Tax=Dietzia cinnamea TaxID=321318 RepID=UPI0021A881DD|nr:O-antigen ligase family protein [Dietzia cinnamea]MCT2140672.1 O-antigen ligase family protein [Dietzia cinnamea]